jgi:hypothetical protein
MRLLLLRIGPSDDAGYPVALYAESPERPDWTALPVAEGYLPGDLAEPPPPVHPDDDTPLGPTRIREFLLTTATQSDTFTAIGAWLFELLTGNPAGQRWWTLFRDPEPCRTVLDIEPPELRSLPWELLYDRTSEVRPFASYTNPIARGPVDFHAGPAPAWPVRVLIVLAADPADATLEAADELRTIQQTLPEFDGRLDIEVLDRPDRAQLFDTLEDARPGIVHFVGHGGIHQDQPVLEFQTRDGQRWRLKTEDIANHFQEWRPQLVVLNACRSAAGGVDPAIATGIDSFEAAFIERGVPAVLAMQGDIRGDAARTLSERFYQALADGRSVDAAVAQARGRIGDAPALGWRRREWCLPCLRLAQPAEGILPTLDAIPESRRDDIHYSDEFRQIRPFVDRCVERRTLWKAHEPLVAVIGPDDLGKTWLVYWMLRHWAWAGRRLAYVDLGGGRLLFLDVLRRIIDSEDRSPILRGLAPEPFYRFNHQLGYYLQNREPEPYVEGTIVPVPEGPLPPGGEHVVSQIFGAFREALQEAACADETVLVLDHVGGIAGDQFPKYICEHLLLPIARNHLAPVRAVVVLNDQQHRDRQVWPNRLDHLAGKIEVDAFPSENFVEIALEFCLRSGKVPEDKEMALIRILGQTYIDGPWGGDQFALVKQVLRL